MNLWHRFMYMKFGREPRRKGVSPFLRDQIALDLMRLDITLTPRVQVMADTVMETLKREKVI